MKTQEKYADDLWDISEIPVGEIIRDWFEDGIRVLVVRGPFHSCVYFGIPESHPLAGHGYDDLPIRVHGGLTFSEKGGHKWWPEGFWWYGYDYGHCNDYMFSRNDKIKMLYREIGKKWTIKQIVEDTWGGLYDLKKLMRLAEKLAPLRGKE